VIAKLNQVAGLEDRGRIESPCRDVVVGVGDLLEVGLDRLQFVDFQATILNGEPRRVEKDCQLVRGVPGCPYCPAGLEHSDG